MYRTVTVTSRTGRVYEVPMTAEQANFFLRLAEFRAAANPSVTFSDVVLEKKAKERKAMLN